MTTTKRPTDPTELREAVSEGYARVAREKTSCCGPQTSCCGAEASSDATLTARRLGYDDDALDSLPDDANLGLGCGNPTAIAALAAGETVLDLGAGAGIDVFLAARQVGPTGKVIGVDMTDDMLALARHNAQTGGYDNVEFRKGIIEALPVDDASVDVILSNCVINLSPEKDRVFAEAHRVLRDGGRLQMTDTVLERALPQAALDSLEAYVGCVGGGELVADYRKLLEGAGFREVHIRKKGTMADILSPDNGLVSDAMERFGLTWDGVKDIASAVVNVEVTAVK